MKLKVTFVKRHPSGINVGAQRIFPFEHSVRLIEEGYCEADVAELEEATNKWRERIEERNKIVKERMEASKALQKQQDEQVQQERKKVEKQRAAREKFYQDNKNKKK